MLRIALSLYLIISATLGPGLCSCAYFSIIAPKCAAKETFAKSPTGCCQAKSKGHDAKPASEQSGPKRSAPFCPCNQHQDIPVALSLAAKSLDLLDHSKEASGKLALYVFLSSTFAYFGVLVSGTHSFHLSTPSAHEGCRTPFVLLC